MSNDPAGEQANQSSNPFESPQENFETLVRETAICDYF
jgi:hypothetical protein